MLCLCVVQKFNFDCLLEIEPTCQTPALQSPLHRTLLEILQEGLVREEYKPTELDNVTVKTIYKSPAADGVPAPKIEAKYQTVNFRNVVYPCIAYSILETEPKDKGQNRAKNAFCPSSTVPRQGAGQGASILQLSPSM